MAQTSPSKNPVGMYYTFSREGYLLILMVTLFLNRDPVQKSLIYKYTFPEVFFTFKSKK